MYLPLSMCSIYLVQMFVFWARTQRVKDSLFCVQCRRFLSVLVRSATSVEKWSDFCPCRVSEESIRSIRASIMSFSSDASPLFLLFVTAFLSTKAAAAAIIRRAGLRMLLIISSLRRMLHPCGVFELQAAAGRAPPRCCS